MKLHSLSPTLTRPGSTIDSELVTAGEIEVDLLLLTATQTQPKRALVWQQMDWCEIHPARQVAVSSLHQLNGLVGSFVDTDDAAYLTYADDTGEYAQTHLTDKGFVVQIDDLENQYYRELVTPNGIDRWFTATMAAVIMWDWMNKRKLPDGMGTELGHQVDLLDKLSEQFDIG